MPITLQDYYTASGRYPGRAASPELTAEIKKNADQLITAVNKLLAELGITDIDITSGYRPTGVNSGVPGSAPNSAHKLGQAIDLADIHGHLKQLIAANPDKLRRLGLMMEDGRSTPGWCHLDTHPRKDRPSRIFIP